MWIKRVTGGRDEIVVFHRLSWETRIDQAFQVPDDVGAKLLGDETGRFEKTTAPKDQ